MSDAVDIDSVAHMKRVVEKLNKYPAVPRYTSYPTAPHFYLLEAETRKRWLSELTPNAVLSLYLHLPYCAKQCWYCGCNTRISRRYEPVERYVATLCAEISLAAEVMGRRQRVGHIHFGGGSPSLLTPADFARLMRQVSESFGIHTDCCIAIEVDPRHATAEKINAYARHGVNRLSIGVQDFDPAVQQAINRHQPFEVVSETVGFAQTSGITNISFDLVYGLPMQTREGFAQTLRQVLSLRPGRLALFGYAHVPWMKKGMRLIDEQTLPDAALRCAMVEVAQQMMGDAGYMAVGLDHYALPDDSLAIARANGTLRRNFQGYGTDPHDVLVGLGASAISHLPQGYVQNPPLIEAYTEMVEQGKLPQQKGFALSADDRLRKQVIEALMCGGHVSLDDICRAHNVSVTQLDSCLPALEALAEDGLIQLHGRDIVVPGDIPQALRLACAAFDAYHQPQPNRHAQVA